MVDDEDITNLNEEEDERNFMSKDCKLVVMAATHPCNFIGKTFPEVIIPDHNLQQKFRHRQVL